ncbi:MAG: cupin domain-containing protein [Halobacteriota archaeon]
MGAKKKLFSQIYALPVLALCEGENWKPYSVFNGRAANLQDLSCHTSVLAGGCSPHPPHEHVEEEILIVLSGEINIILKDPDKPSHDIQKRLRKGKLAYYPAHFAHTLENTTRKPANYLMFKWRGASPSSDNILNFGCFDALPIQNAVRGGQGFSPQLLFEGATQYLKILHCHTTVLEPGAGYLPHPDPYDVAILMLDGEVQTLGQQVRAPAVIFYEAGSPHGMHNPTGTAARYLVFEFWRRNYENILIRKIKKSIKSFHRR